MRNKKRIQKRVQKIERIEFSRFIKKFEHNAKKAEQARRRFITLMTSISELNSALREVKILDENVSGYEFQFPQYNPQLDAFILEIRALTGYEEEIVKILCSSLPEEHWETCKGLLMVGFSLKDALEEIVETYRL